MKLNSLFALLALSAPAIAPLAAHAQTADGVDVPAIAPLPLAPKSAATPDAFVWRFAPPVGSRWTMRSFVRTTSTSQMPAMEGNGTASMKLKMIQKMTADYDVLSRDALGATTIRLTLRAMTNDVDSEFDGEAINEPLPKSEAAKSVAGAQLTIKQAPDGAVWGVVGLRAFQRKILESSGLLDEATVNSLLDAHEALGDNRLVKSLSMMAGTLPTSPIRAGESWAYNVSLPAQFPMALDVTGTRTLKSLDQNIAVVADRATYKGGDAQKTIPVVPEMGNIKVDYSQLTGSIAGTSRVQRSSGLPLETTVNQTIKGSVSTRIPAAKGVAAQTIKVPLDVTSSTRIVLEPR